VWRAHRHQGPNAVRQAEAGDGVARVESPHAVSDDVDPLGRAGVHQLHQPGGAHGDGAGRRETGHLHVVAVLLEDRADAPVVGVAHLANHQLVEAEETVHQHHRVARSRRGEAAPPEARTGSGAQPPPEAQARAGQDGEDRDDDQRLRAAHATHVAEADAMQQGATRALRQSGSNS